MRNVSHVFQKKIHFTTDAAVFASHFPYPKVRGHKQNRQDNQEQEDFFDKKDSDMLWTCNFFVID